MGRCPGSSSPAHCLTGSPNDRRTGSAAATAATSAAGTSTRVSDLAPHASRLPPPKSPLFGLRSAGRRRPESGEKRVTTLASDGEVLGAEGGGAADVGLEERRRPERVANEPRTVVQEEVVAVATPVAQGEFRRGQLHDSNPQRRHHVQLWPADAEPTSMNHRGPWRLGW